MRALLLVPPVTLVAALVTGRFNLKADEDSFCQGLTCGVFVSSSKGDDASGNGTRDKPFATLSRAVRAAQGALGIPVYACGEAFEDAVSITGNTALFGARDCTAGWEYKPDTPSTLTAAPGKIPLRISAGIDVGVYDFAIRASDAVAPGDSSIVVVVDAGTTLDIARCSMEAGNGAGADDAAPEKAPAESGIAGVDGGEACSAAEVPGGVAPAATCNAGGDGAAGDSTDPGSAGVPKDQKNGGASETASGVECVGGNAGSEGTDGADGLSATKSLGALDATVGFAGVAGTDGAPGIPGGGGGGGGASRGGVGATKCSNGAKAGGASGGSGGAGGCGGLGGKGGGAGGSSIGIVSLGAQLTFKDVTLKTASGGKGGDGAAGQPGGEGGKGGKGGGATAADLHAACNGGDGGNGGNGGNGGGGRGGHSIGIAYLDKAPDATGLTITTGAAGAAGEGSGASGKAQPGVAAQTQAF